MQSMINTLLDPVVNFGKVIVSTGYTSTDTEVILTTGDGTKLPNPVPSGSFNLVWFNNSTYSDPADDPYVEIVRCIARVGDTLTLMRAQEGTLASAKNIPTKIYKMILSPTKKTITDIQTEYQSGVSTHSALSTGVHGVGADTIDGISARNSAISTHSLVTSNVHGFDALGDAPAQTHGISRHTGIIGDHTTNISNVGINTHAQIDTGITDSINHIAAVAPHSGHDTPAQRDTAIANHTSLTTAHGSVGTVLGLTTADGRYAPVSAGVSNGNAHDHSGGDGAQINHTTLSNIGINTHAQIDTGITNSISHIAAAAPHSGHDTPAQRDTAIGTAVDTHKNLITGVHGVTGSYILGTEDIGVINGIAGLDSSGKVPISQLPALAITNVYTVANQVAQLALFATTQEGDVAIRTDENRSYVRNAGVSGTMADWSLLLTPTDAVLSVFGRTGAVAATTNDYTWAQINKATSSIGDITTKSHTLLTDIGANTHATIDAHMTSATAHGSDGTILGLTTADGRYAPLAEGVLNGDLHDHSGGDGAQINHTTLSSIGVNTHAQIDTGITNSISHIAAAAPHSGHDTPAQRDTAIGTAVSTHANLVTGVHGTTTGYILGTEDRGVANGVASLDANTKVPVSQLYIGVANGIASLDANTKVPTSQLPALALTNVYTVANQVAQLALFATTQEGDVAIRTDENRSYVRNAGVSGTMADWSLLLTPTDAVLSVFGRTGAVVATTNDYTWAQINKSTSSIGDIATRSHTLLTDIGVYDHATIDIHMTSATAHGSTSAATANAIIQRDAAGRAKIVAPSAIDDIARKDTVDAVQTNLTTHGNLTTAHGSVGTVLGLTTADGRYAPVSAGVSGGNAHTHSTGDGAQINHTTLSNIGTNTHASIDTAISASTGHIAAAAPHSGHDTPAQRDTAIGTAVGNHTGLITGVHGVTGSYILGTEDIGVINGIAGLDSSGKVPISQLPALALTNVYTVANQVAQLALFTITQEGDVAIRTDENRSYVRNAGVSGTMADWSLLLTPTDAVLTVFGRTGAVVATTNDYTWVQINKATSSIGDITTRSHTLLTDIGANTHATIDAHMTSATAHGSTSAATANAIIQRDAAGRAKIVAPSAIDDIARKDTVDAVQSNLTTHGNLTTAHGSVGTVLGLTTADGRYAPLAEGVLNGDLHDHSGGDGAQINHTTLSNIGTNTHASIDTAISASTGHIAAAAPHSGHDTPSQRDTAITNHANLITGVHGVTGSYILGTEDRGVANGVASLDANTKVPVSQLYIGVANGIASLDANTKVPISQLPALALTNVYTVANQVAQLALFATTQEGDVAIRTDENRSYVRNAGVSGTMADWSLLLTPTDAVLSVFGRTGAVVATTNDYTWAQINKSTSSIGDIATRSHTLLTDIGVYDHATIDIHMTSATAHGSTSAATANAIIQRDAAGRAKIVAPSAIDDIARKDTVDVVQTNLTTHGNLTTAHGSVGTVLGLTTADGRYAPVSAGVSGGNAHTHSTGDGAQINHTTLSNIGVNTHAQIDTGITNSISHIAAAAPHSSHEIVTNKNVANGYAGTDASNYIILARFQPITTVATTYTITANDYTVVCSAAITVTLPTAVGIPGRIYNIKNTSVGTVTVGTTLSQTIDGSITRLIATTNETITVQSNNANWVVI